jgi:hypothetical protein
VNRLVRAAVGAGLLLAVIVVMGSLTRAPFRATPGRAELRLAWRFRVPQTEQCRRPTSEELAELPVHMRQEEICERREGRYRLEVAVDGQIAHRSTVEAAGARGDRPIYVFEAVPLEPGAHRIRVVFERLDPAADTGSAAPDRLALVRDVRAAIHDVLLVTYDPAAAALGLRREGDL